MWNDLLQATIIVSDVQKVSDTAFAGCMGFATVDERTGFDILLTLLDDGHTLIDARTENGDTHISRSSSETSVEAPSIVGTEVLLMVWLTQAHSMTGSNRAASRRRALTG